MFILCVAVSVVALLCSEFFHIEAKTLKNGNRCSLFQHEKAEKKKKTGREGKKKDLQNLMIPYTSSTFKLSYFFHAFELLRKLYNSKNIFFKKLPQIQAVYSAVT